MDLDIQPVRLSLKEYKDVKQLYMRAFPKYEREAWSWLLLKSKYKRADFMAFYDQQRFVGFAYVIHSHAMHYILYLAVNDQVRSKGYGTRIINELRALYPKDSLVLDIEQPDPTTTNNHQRLRRLNFYRRNGFFPTSRVFKEEKVTFQVLATNKKVKQQKVDKIFEWFEWPLGWLMN